MEDEAVKEEVDGDVAAIQEEVSERRHMLSVLDCVVCPCRLGSSISHLRDRCFITTGMPGSAAQ